MDAKQLDDYLDTVLIGGRERREVVIASYDDRWPRRYEAERERIASALASAAPRIEHVGSTSVPDLGAKRAPLSDRPLIHARQIIARRSQVVGRHSAQIQEGQHRLRTAARRIQVRRS